MKNKTFYTEAAYLVGLTVLALGNAFMEAANFGVGMVVAPAYLLYLKVSEFLPFFTFGMAGYVVQVVLLIALVLVMGRFKVSYLFSFVTVILYGVILDCVMPLIGLIPHDHIAIRIVFYLVGLTLTSAGVAFLFNTYLSPELYDLFVKELTEKTGKKLSSVKTVYDCTSCLIGIVMSFVIFGFGHFEGVKLGTIVCALVNGKLIGMFSDLYNKTWTFRDKFKKAHNT